MTKGETVKLFALIAAAYPRDTAFAGADGQMVGVWADMLRDLPLELALWAVRAHVAASPFPPGISDIRGLIAKGAAPSLDASQAWGLLMEALRKYGYYQEGKAREMLAGPAWEAFRRTFPSWQHFCMSENIMADRAHYLKVYEGMIRQKQEALRLPDGAKPALAKAAPKALEGGNGQDGH